MKFELSPSQLDKLGKWMDKQKFNPPHDTYIYSFELTINGVIVKVKNSGNNEEIDLTEYERP